jgi:predicted XRE-type DNA-binding protein
MESEEVVIEEFLPIPGYEGLYEASDLGKLKSLYRETLSKNGKRMIFPEKITSPKPHTSGYVRFNLTKNNIRTTFSAHVIVATLFIENPHNYPIVNHKDGIKWNNGKTNLEWGTSSMNNQHAIDTGLMPILVGEFGRNAKLKDSEVFDIRFHWKNRSYSQTELGTMYNVDQSTISKIVNNKERIK